MAELTGTERKSKWSIRPQWLKVSFLQLFSEGDRAVTPSGARGFFFVLAKKEGRGDENRDIRLR